MSTLLFLLLAATAVDGSASATLLDGVRVETGAGAVLDDVDVLIRDGVVVAIDSEIDPPWDASVIHGDGLVVWPGIIDGWSTAFVPERSPTAGEEDDERRPTDEGVSWGMPLERRTGLAPEFRVADVLTDGAKAPAALREAGVTSVLAVPGRRGCSGRSALVDLSGGVPAARLLNDDVFLHLTLGSPRGGYPSTLMGLLAHYRQFISDARTNQARWERYERLGRTVRRPRLDRALSAIRPALDGTQRVVIEADSARAISKALDFAEEVGFDVVIAGGSEAARVAERLKATGTEVLLGLAWPEEPKGLDDASKAEEPRRVLEDRSARRRHLMRTAQVLSSHGVSFAFCSLGLDAPGELMKRAREAVEAGLPREVAIAALTSSAARILGVHGFLGVVRPGAQANLSVFAGDPLAEDAAVRHVFVRGEHHEFDGPAKATRKSSGGGAAASVNGKWNVTVHLDSGDREYVLDVTQEGDVFTGVATADSGSGEVSNGAVSGSSVSWRVVYQFGSRTYTFEFRGSVVGDGMSGTVTINGGENHSFAATRSGGLGR